MNKFVNKEFVHDIETGKYQIIDNEVGTAYPVNAFGVKFTQFKEGVTGFSNGVERKIKINYHKQVKLYTPHNDKFYGYFQLPMAKLNDNKIEERNAASRQSRFTQHRFNDLKNSFNSPNTIIKIENPQEQMKIDESSFIPNGDHLTGTIADSLEVMKTQRAKSLNFRKGTRKIKQELDFETIQNPFICKQINQKKVYSPSKTIMQKLLGRRQSLQQGRISRSYMKEISQNSQYKSIDRSLRQDSIEFYTLKQSHMISTYRNSNSVLDASQNGETLITCKDHKLRSEQLDTEFNTYPKSGFEDSIKKHPRVKDTKINTEFELYLKHRDEYIEF